MGVFSFHDYVIITLMDMTIVSLFLFVVGALFGSFAAAQVWRLRANQLRLDEREGEKISAKEKKSVEKLKEGNALQDRSVCLHCGHQLSWYDLMPIFSWLQLRGRCRYCHKKIGFTEPLIELGLAIFFVTSYVFWPYPLHSTIEIVRLILWLSAGVALAILFLYDLKWYLLPDKIVFPLIGIGVVNSGLVVLQQGLTLGAFMSVIYACLALSGLYYLLYVLSRHQWVGFGDIKLGLALALLLADWRLALLTLFLANLLGTVIVLPLLLLKKIKRQTHVPFGPLLIVGWFLAGIFGVRIIDWYWAVSLGVS